MITRIQLSNFGPLTKIDWAGLGKINLVIGGNSRGKTFLLKSLYSAMRTLEEYRRGDIQRTAAEILVDKLYWTFQPEKIGDLVTKGADGHLQFTLTWKTKDFCYGFGKDTAKQISSLENQVPPRASNAILLPAEEVLSRHNVILKSREDDKVFGFDDTYLDLACALRNPSRRGRNYAEFSSAREKLEELFGGKTEYEEGSGRWYFRKSGQKFPIGVTAEGSKKIAILDLLLSNRFLDPESIVLIDEPESALHPKAISTLLDIVAMLADKGIKFFMASHSYLVVKKLLLIAQEKGLSIPVLAYEDEAWRCAELKDGMPDNAIINESIHVYEQEVEMALA